MNKISTFIYNVFKGKSLLHGLIIAIMTTILAGLQNSLSVGKLPNKTELHHLILLSLGVGITYLLKNGLFGSSRVSKP